MEDKASTDFERQTSATAAQPSTGSSAVASREHGHKDKPQKKKVKLDRSGLSEAKPKSLTISNGVKTDLKSPPNEQKTKLDGTIKSPSKNTKEGSNSPVKLSLAKLPLLGDSDDDDIPLVARAKPKHGSPLKSPTGSSAANGALPKSSPSNNARLKSPTKELQNIEIKKLKLDSSPKVDNAKVKTESSASKVDGAAKKMRFDSSLTASPKVDGVKKAASSESSSPKVDGAKMTKSETSKTDVVKKLKSPDSKQPSLSKTDGVAKMKSPDSKVSSSTKVDGVKKLKSPDSKLSSSSKVDGIKKTGDAGAVKKIKSDRSTSSSPKVDGTKKGKCESSFSKKEKSDSRSSKVEGIIKEKSDYSSKVNEVKQKVKSESSSSKVSEIKKIGKSESNSSKSELKKGKSNSNSSKVSEVKKEKSETSSSSKVDVVKKEKSDSPFKKMESGSASKVDKLKLKSDGSSSKSTSKGSEIKKKTSDSSSKVNGVKKEKSESGSSKDDGVKKKEKSETSTIKVDGVKKVKSESSSSSKVDADKKKVKSETSSAKVDAAKKVKLQTNTPKVDGIKKEKSESSSSKVDESKMSSVSSLSSAKVDKIKKAKSESSSSEADSGKKRKSDSKISSSPVKKLKTEHNSTAMKSSTEDSDDDTPLAARAADKVKKEPKKSLSPVKERKRKLSEDDDDEDEDKPLAKRKSITSGKSVKKEKTKPKTKEKNKKEEKKETGKKEAKAKKPEEEVWKWWEEEKHPEGVKWLSLQHKGPYFPPTYEPLPNTVKFYYDGKEFKLSEKSEEVAGFYAKMLDHDYTSKKIFQENFFEDWRKEMNDEERKLVKNLSKCGFQEIHAYFVQKNEERKNMTKEEKQKIKEKNEAILQEYGYCTMDNHKERVGNFKIEPPGLFRGRGDHPKQGKLKKRVKANEVIINIGKDGKIPDPPEGQKWKAVTHDNKVTWLACWIENVQGGYKYVMLNPTSRLKGEKDWQKYETARKLKTEIGKIRADYMNDWRSKEMRIRQRGVALYFIDKLALRAGHEKDEDTADTVGCCSLRVEHIKLHREKDNKENVVEFDFLGKDSINYHNLVEVEKRVFKNLELFKQGKSDGDDLFDRLSTTSLNKYLSELMEGLSAKVFRTYNASMTLQDQLNKLETEDNVAAKVLGYNRANRAVAILCNHQRTAPKSFEQSMSNLQQKIEDKKKLIKEAKKDVKELKSELKSSKSAATEKKFEKKKTTLARLQEQLFKLEVTQTDKEENKEIALGTSKLNYLDPRISIAWCQKNDVPIEKIYNKTQRQKFAWAIDMTEQDFEF